MTPRWGGSGSFPGVCRVSPGLSRRCRPGGDAVSARRYHRVPGRQSQTSSPARRPAPIPAVRRSRHPCPRCAGSRPGTGPRTVPATAATPGRCTGGSPRHWRRTRSRRCRRRRRRRRASIRPRTAAFVFASGSAAWAARSSVLAGPFWHRARPPVPTGATVGEPVGPARSYRMVRGSACPPGKPCCSGERRGGRTDIAPVCVPCRREPQLTHQLPSSHAYRLGRAQRLRSRYRCQ